jgi:hypothetical protein
MARGLWTVMAMVLASSCGTQAGSTTVPSVTSPTSSTTPHVSSDDRGVAVTVTGVLSAATTLCPAQEPTCGYALALDGTLGDVADGDFVVGRGWYDGHRVLLAGPLTRGDSPFAQAASQQRPRFSDLELREASDHVIALMNEGTFLVEGGFSIDEGRNRVVVPIEAIDSGGRAELDKLEAVVAVPFIELLDRPLSDLPAWYPAVAGTVDLLTSAARSQGGMDALVTLTLQYDAGANCLYADVDGLRYALVWPFGYSATKSDGVVTIFDPRGDEVAVTGEQIELGGGDDAGAGDGGDGGWIDRTTEGSTCSASSFWIVNGD